MNDVAFADWSSRIGWYL